MKGEDLWSSEIIAALEALWQIHREQTIVVDDLVGAPAAGGVLVTVIEDLEPPVTCALVVDGRVNFLQVDGARTFVAAIEARFGWVIRPRSDLESQKGTVRDRLDARNALGAINVCIIC